MDREIKFRAWDKVLGMVQVIKVAGDGSWFEVSHSNVTDFYTLDRDGANLMQYTGLQDRRGQDIYEGDIVRVQHPNDKMTLSDGRVIYGDFGDTVGRVFWWPEEGGWYHGNSAGRPPKRMWQYCEVIGNVYEQPNLLGPAK